MKIEDLQKIDLQSLQNINEEDIKLFCKKHMTILINIMLIGLTIFAIIILISGQSTFANGIKKKITELEEKADEIEKGEIVDRQYEEIISFLPAAISIDDLRNKLTKMAVDSKVQIISFEPKGEKQDEIMKASNFEMNILSANYQNIVAFTSNLEKLPNAIRVDTWTGKMEESVFKGENIHTKESPISGIITLSAINLKENE